MKETTLLWLVAHYDGFNPCVFWRGFVRDHTALRFLRTSAIRGELMRLAPFDQDAPISCECLTVADALPVLMGAADYPFDAQQVLSVQLSKPMGYNMSVTASIIPAKFRGLPL